MLLLFDGAAAIYLTVEPSCNTISNRLGRVDYETVIAEPLYGAKMVVGLGEVAGKGDQVSTAELERTVLETLARMELSGESSTQKELLEQARAWKVDEYSLRDVLSKLLEEKLIELTERRELRPAREKIPA